MRLQQTLSPIDRARHTRLPAALLAGILLIAIAWPMAWAGPAPFSEHTFFPLWLGYVLTVDGFVQIRAGSSLLTRDRQRFIFLFIMAIPLWWGFEGVNRFVRNWHYIMPYQPGWLSYFLQGSLAFSTVVPAVLETAELYRTVGSLRRIRRWRAVSPSPRQLVAISIGGAVAAALAIAFPDQAFPFVWLAAFFILDPLNALLGQNSIFGQVRHGRWDTVLVLFAAGITCGFFWEMWNYFSMPKWVYTVPYVGEPKIFEMPVLGYFGYLPFALEVYAIYQSMHGIIFRRRDTYLRVDQPAPTGNARGERG